MSREAYGNACLSQLLDGLPVAITVGAVARLEHPANLPGRRVKTRSWGPGNTAGSGVRILSENAPDPKGPLACLTQPLARFGGDLRDHLGEERSQLLLRESVPPERRSGRVLVQPLGSRYTGC